MIVVGTLSAIRRLNSIAHSNHIANNLTRRNKLALISDKINYTSAKKMSSNVEDEMKNPSRHFDYKQLVEKKKEGVILVDVREPSEINETGKLPDSIHIPLGDLAAALELSNETFKSKYSADKPAKDNPVIFSCKAGGRSLKALRIALGHGYLKAGNYKGGWLDWAENSKKSS